jgi:hypothetical protein
MAKNSITTTMSDDKAPRKTFLVNLISGPGAGKSVLSALIFANLKLNRFSTEFVQEYAKTLVWTKDFTTLNNQYYVTTTQFNLLKQINGKVDFIVTDGPIIGGLYYNLHNADNTSNIEKTNKLILECHNQFNNINIFLTRGNFAYETQGRLQTEDEAKEIDVILKHLLRHNSIEYNMFDSTATKENVDKIVQYIIERSKM